MNTALETAIRIPRENGHSIRTFTGILFWPLDPQPEEVNLADIAHALSLQCRFSGHTVRHYSVAQHSVHVSRLAEQIAWKGVNPSADYVRKIALWGLLHDASEAYLQDMPSPLKASPHFGPLYKKAEELVISVIAERFGLLPFEPIVVKEADRVLLVTEQRDLMNNSRPDFSVTPLRETIEPVAPEEAEAAFLDRFFELRPEVR